MLYQILPKLSLICFSNSCAPIETHFTCIQSAGMTPTFSSKRAAKELFFQTIELVATAHINFGLGQLPKSSSCYI